MLPLLRGQTNRDERHQSLLFAVTFEPQNAVTDEAMCHLTTRCVSSRQLDRPRRTARHSVSLFSALLSGSLIAGECPRVADVPWGRQAAIQSARLSSSNVRIVNRIAPR